MIRITAPAPPVWGQDELLVLARTVWPDARACNEVDGDVAVYLPDDATVDPADEAEWAALVAAYQPPPSPRAALLAALDAIDDAETWAEAKPYVTAILTAATQLVPA